MRVAPLLAAAAVWPFVEPLLPVLRRVRVPVLPTGATPMTVLHLSDLHLLPRHARRSAWVRRLARLRPDLVVSTGDHLSSARALPLLVETLAPFTADGTPGVFVPGNNDFFTPARPRLTGYLHDGPPRPRRPDLDWSATAARLQDAGWTDLTHRRAVLRVGGRDVVLTGTDDAHLRRARYDRVAGRVEGFGDRGHPHAAARAAAGVRRRRPRAGAGRAHPRRSAAAAGARPGRHELRPRAQPGTRPVAARPRQARRLAARQRRAGHEPVPAGAGLLPAGGDAADAHRALLTTSGRLGPARLRGVAQLGSALRSGRRGRRFKSCHPDQPPPRRGTASRGGHRREPVPFVVSRPGRVRQTAAMTEPDLPLWERRFRAPRVTLPEWALHAPDRCLYVSNASGTFELYAWDRADGTTRQVTDRPHGTSDGALSPDGEQVWWFDDTDGDEFGTWRRQPFGGGPDEDAAPDVPAGYSAGLEIGDRLALVGAATDDGTAVHVVRTGSPPVLLYASEHDAAVAGLSADEELAVLEHSEHGDSRHPALRVVRTADGTTVWERWDGEGLGLSAVGFSPVPGDRRLLAVHERDGRPLPFVVDPDTGQETTLDLEGLPGDLEADWYADGSALLVRREARGRSTLHRVALDGAHHRPPGARGHRRRRHRATGRRWSSSRGRPRQPRPSSARRPAPSSSHRRASRRRRRCRCRTPSSTGPAGRCTRSWRPPRATGRSRRCSCCTAARPGRTTTLRRRPRGVRRPRLRRRPRQLPRLHRLRHRLARRPHRPAGPHRARGRRRRARLGGRERPGRPGPHGRHRRVVGRLPDAARPRHAARALGVRRGRRPRGRLPGRLRGRDGADAGVRPLAVRRVARRGARPLRALVTAHARRRGARPGARAGRCERPALPAAADRQLARGGAGARQGRRGLPLRRRPRLARRRRAGAADARRARLRRPPAGAARARPDRPATPWASGRGSW